MFFANYFHIYIMKKSIHTKGIFKKMLLTKEQQEFVTQNHNLIYKILDRYSLPAHRCDCYNQEDWYGLAAISLCQAAATFDESKGYKFSTYAGKCIENAILMQFRSKQSRDRIPANLIYSGDYPYESKGDIYTMFDIIPDNKAISEDGIIAKVDLENQLKNEKDRTIEIMNMLIQGYTLKEIGDKFHLSRERIRRIRNDVTEKMHYNE